MTYPQQPGGSDPRVPRVPSPYEGTPAEYGQPAPSAQPAQPPYGSPVIPPQYGQTTDVPGYTDPYTAGPYTQGPRGVQPMTWRTILAYVLSPMALIFMPLLGVVGIVLASLAVKGKEKTAPIALGVVIVSTILGVLLNSLAQNDAVL